MSLERPFEGSPIQERVSNMSEYEREKLVSVMDGATHLASQVKAYLDFIDRQDAAGRPIKNKQNLTDIAQTPEFEGFQKLELMITAASAAAQQGEVE